MATYRVVEAKYDGDAPSRCVADWLNALVRDRAARVVREGPRIGDDAWVAQGRRSYIWGVEQLRDWRVIRCDDGRIGDWDGTSPIEGLDSSQGPAPYTRWDAMADAALATGARVAQAVDDASSGIARYAPIALALALVVGAVWIGRSSGR